MADISFGSLQNLSNSIRQAIISERQEDTENERIREAKDWEKSMMLNQQEYQSGRDVEQRDFMKAMEGIRQTHAEEMAMIPYEQRELLANEQLEGMLSLTGAPETDLDDTLAGPGLTDFAKDMIRGGELDIEGGYQSATGLMSMEGVDPRIGEMIQRGSEAGGQAGLGVVNLMMPQLMEQAFAETDPLADLTLEVREAQLNVALQEAERFLTGYTPPSGGYGVSSGGELRNFDSWYEANIGTLKFPEHLSTAGERETWARGQYMGRMTETYAEGKVAQSMPMPQLDTFVQSVLSYVNPMAELMEIYKSGELTEADYAYVANAILNALGTGQTPEDFVPGGEGGTQHTGQLSETGSGTFAR